MVELLKPRRGGFLRPFGCGFFVREFLMGNGPNWSPRIDPGAGAPQADIFHHYKQAILRATALDRATRYEERQARREKRLISPDNIEKLTETYLRRLPYKSSACRYHSFVVYFSNLQRLGWVEFSGIEEPSAFRTITLLGRQEGITVLPLLAGLPRRLTGRIRSTPSTARAGVSK